MKIAEVEKQTGISKQTIRFYEKEGLIEPGRNSENQYREYDPQDVKKLKRISIMRKLNVPIPEIKEVMEGTRSFTEVIDRQREQIAKEREEQDALIAFCDELKGQSVDWLDEDYFLEKLEKEERKGNPIEQLWEDFKQVYRSEKKKYFRFTTENFVDTAKDFTNELFRYATENKVDITITKEGMYPQFVLNGVEYKAQLGDRVMKVSGKFNIIHQTAHCEMLHPELAEPIGIPERRKKILQWIVRYWLWIVFVLLFFLLVLIEHFSV